MNHPKESASQQAEKTSEKFPPRVFVSFLVHSTYKTKNIKRASASLRKRPYATEDMEYLSVKEHETVRDATFADQANEIEGIKSEHEKIVKDLRSKLDVAIFALKNIAAIKPDFIKWSARHAEIKVMQAQEALAKMEEK